MLRNPNDSRQILLFYILAILAGVFLDFFFNGICKIIWFIIYAPTYIALGHTVYSQVDRTLWRAHATKAAFVVISAAFISHFFAMGHKHFVTYPMDLTSSSPITLNSADWPQTLLVTSDTLLQHLNEKPSESKGLPVVILEVTNYGCIESLKVQSVANIDVQNDTNARWTWKTPGGASAPKSIGPGSEDKVLPWCLLPVFYGV